MGPGLRRGDEYGERGFPLQSHHDKGGVFRDGAGGDKLPGYQQMKKIGVGLVGSGFMGRSHSHAFRAAAGVFELPAVPVL